MSCGTTRCRFLLPCNGCRSPPCHVVPPSVIRYRNCRAHIDPTSAVSPVASTATVSNAVRLAVRGLDVGHCSGPARAVDSESRGSPCMDPRVEAQEIRSVCTEDGAAALDQLVPFDSLVRARATVGGRGHDPTRRRCRRGRWPSAAHPGRQPAAGWWSGAARCPRRSAVGVRRTARTAGYPAPAACGAAADPGRLRAGEVP
jgi:hypothetical protein